MGEYGNYGWHPSKPDIRNRVVDTRGMTTVTSVDLRTTGFLPSVWDQSQLGACVDHAVGAAYEFDRAKQGGQADQTPSRLFLYYNARSLENTISSDAGSTCADGIKALNKYGAPAEADWPYLIDRFTVKPPDIAYTHGEACQSVKYASVPQTVRDMQAILSAGYPIVIGFTVYASFESDAVAASGVVPMPTAGEGVLGGHSVLLVGFQTDGTWICRNSWGVGWGQGGYFTMPQAYLLDSRLSGDFWVVQQVESPDPTPNPPAPVPVPPDPTPIPGPPLPPSPTDEVDQQLVSAADAWEKTIWSKFSKAGKLKTAIDLWKRTHGYG